MVPGYVVRPVSKQEERRLDSLEYTRGICIYSSLLYLCNLFFTCKFWGGNSKLFQLLNEDPVYCIQEAITEVTVLVERSSMSALVAAITSLQFGPCFLSLASERMGNIDTHIYAHHTRIADSITSAHGTSFGEINSSKL
jgi:hypothetical protein